MALDGLRPASVGSGVWGAGMVAAQDYALSWAAAGGSGVFTGTPDGVLGDGSAARLRWARSCTPLGGRPEEARRVEERQAVSHTLRWTTESGHQFPAPSVSRASKFNLRN